MIMKANEPPDQFLLDVASKDVVKGLLKYCKSQQLGRGDAAVNLLTAAVYLADTHPDRKKLLALMIDAIRFISELEPHETRSES
jgi:hypothetical protein